MTRDRLRRLRHPVAVARNRWRRASRRRARERRARAAGPHRYSATNRDEAARAMASASLVWSQKRPGPVVIVGADDDHAAKVRAELQRAGLVSQTVRTTELEGDLDVLAGACCIVLAVDDSQGQFDVARRLVENPRTADVPVEYVGLPRLDNAPIKAWDTYDNGDFVSPLIAHHGDAFFRIYAEVLERFKLKTDVRDYLDLCQAIESVIARRIPGDLAEFGSYFGHSGYLTSRVLEHFGSDKRLFMFDMFESFPEESVGIDGFWSGTHEVDFAQVSAKFEDRVNVSLIKGDFTETLATSEVGTLALAFVDCDSYRATRSLLPQLWDRHIAPGGLVVMEDYGHAALLGNRLAVHEFFDGRRDAYTNFSQFSGLFTAVKLPAD